MHSPSGADAVLQCYDLAPLAGQSCRSRPMHPHLILFNIIISHTGYDPAAWQAWYRRHIGCFLAQQTWSRRLAGVVLPPAGVIPPPSRRGTAAHRGDPAA